MKRTIGSRPGTRATDGNLDSLKQKTSHPHARRGDIFNENGVETLTRRVTLIEATPFKRDIAFELLNR